jgi:hypothetical protein
MRRVSHFTAFFLLAASVWAAVEKDTYHPDWNSRRYTKAAFPEAWRPAGVPPTERDLSAFQQFKFATIHIKDVVARFGIPDRYLVRTRPRAGYYDWLIYDLPDGYSVGFFVGKPPADGFAAGVIIDSKGKLLRLIK